MPNSCLPTRVWSSYGTGPPCVSLDSLEDDLLQLGGLGDHLAEVGLPLEAT